MLRMSLPNQVRTGLPTHAMGALREAPCACYDSPFLDQFMAKLEDLQPNTSVKGILPDRLVAVVSVQWFGSEALELTYKDPTGRVANQLLYRHDEPRLEIAEAGRPWNFDGDGAMFRLVSEAHR